MSQKDIERENQTLKIRCRAYEKLLRSLDRESVAYKITIDGLIERNRILMCQGSSDGGPDTRPGGLRHPLDTD